MMQRFFRYHFEWAALLTGLILMALLNPYVDTGSLCLFELAGIENCPGEGLGHAIALTFRGSFREALQAHVMGPAAILILAGRILYLVRRAFKSTKINSEDGAPWLE